SQRKIVPSFRGGIAAYWHPRHAPPSSLAQSVSANQRPSIGGRDPSPRSTGRRTRRSRRQRRTLRDGSSQPLLSRKALLGHAYVTRYAGSSSGKRVYNESTDSSRHYRWAT